MIWVARGDGIVTVSTVSTAGSPGLLTLLEPVPWSTPKFQSKTNRYYTSHVIILMIDAGISSLSPRRGPREFLF